MKITYDLNHFIKKFETIPDNKIIELYFVGYNGDHCANGHCGVTSRSGPTDESKALQRIFSVLNLTGMDGSAVNDRTEYSEKAARVNNGRTKEYQQPTPKQRILAALYDIKAMQEPKVVERTVYVVVDEKIKEQTKELIYN